MHNVELLVDVLNYESLNIALENGADAVCIGDGLKNFSYDDLRKSIELSHNLDKKIYLYFNKIPHEKDLLDIKKYARVICVILKDNTFKMYAINDNQAIIYNDSELNFIGGEPIIF